MLSQITRYGVVGPTVTFNEYLARFPCNKECMKGQEKSMMILRISVMIPKIFW